MSIDRIHSWRNTTNQVLDVNRRRRGADKPSQILFDKWVREQREALKRELAEFAGSSESINLIMRPQNDPEKFQFFRALDIAMYGKRSFIGKIEDLLNTLSPS